jgi:CRISPR/Cas system-associated endoribonuclease Cas2
VPALLASYHGAVQFAVYETVMHSFKEQDLKTVRTRSIYISYDTIIVIILYRAAPLVLWQEV